MFYQYRHNNEFVRVLISSHSELSFQQFCEKIYEYLPIQTCDVSHVTPRTSILNKEIKPYNFSTNHSMSKTNHPNRLISSHIHKYIYFYSHESLCITVKIQPLFAWRSNNVQKRKAKKVFCGPLLESNYAGHIYNGIEKTFFFVWGPPTSISPSVLYHFVLH